MASYLNAVKFGSPPFGIPLADVVTEVNFLLGQTAPVAIAPRTSYYVKRSEAALKQDMVSLGLALDGANNAGECDFLLDGDV